jgi:site-specific recombinase XerD
MIKPAVKLWTTGVVCERWSAEQQDDQSQSLHPPCFLAPVRPSRLTCRSVANIVKAYAGVAGFDASTFSGHSLRSGFLTSAAGKGASIFKMMDVPPQVR